MPLLLQPVTFAYALKWATWELNPARRAYKAQQINQTFAAPNALVSYGSGETRTLIPSLKRRVC